MGMMPRLEMAVMKTLGGGAAMCDRELMLVVFCNRRSVQRVLDKLHKEGVLYIARWQAAGKSHRWRPQYALGAGTDAVEPAAKGRLSTPRVKKFLASLNADDKEFLAARRRQLRRVVQRDPLTAMFFGSAK